MKDSIAVAERATGRALSRGEVSAYWSSQARDYALSHPGEWLRLAARKLFNFWNAYQYDDVTTIARLRATGVTWPGLSFGVVGCFGLAGLLSGGWKSPVRLFISATILLHMLALLPAFVTERYRLVAVPGLLVLGAWWILDLYRRLARRELLRAAAPAVVGMAAAFFVSTPQTDASLWSLDFYETGIRETQLGNLDRAQQALETALRYAPAAPDIQFALGNVCLQRNDRNGAKEYYRRALDLNPRHDGVLNNLGVLALEEKRWDLAERFFVISLRTEPDDPKTFYLLARARFGRGDREGAMRAVDEALRRRPAQREFIELREQIGAAR
jgi:Tfp pilus assembly protein PilF